MAAPAGAASRAARHPERERARDPDAAGTCSAFASAYTSYALYDLIGPATTFVLLGLIAVLTMVAATLHGPILAALGLLGAMGSPLLVSSDRPQPWALVIYLAFVVLPAYGVAHLRLWRWLALAAAIGVLAWTFLIFVLDQTDALPTMVHLVLQTGLAAIFLIGIPYRHATDGEAGIDWPASGILLAFALAGIAVSSSVIARDARPVFIAAMALVLLATGLRFPPAAPAAAWRGCHRRRRPSRLAHRRRDRQLPKASSIRAAMPSPCGPTLSRPTHARPPAAGDHRGRLPGSARPVAPIEPVHICLLCGNGHDRPAAGAHRGLLAGCGIRAQPAFALVAGGLALAFIAAAGWLNRQPSGQEARSAWRSAQPPRPPSRPWPSA